MHKSKVFWLVVGVAAALRSAAAGPADPQALIDACRASGSAELRIACLERALMEDLANDEQAGHSAVATAAYPMEPATRGVSVGSSPTTAIAQEPVSPASQEPVMAAPASGESVAAAEKSAVEQLGQEQVDARTMTSAKGSERFEVDVISYDFVGRDKLRVRLENGQVWKQHDSDRPNLYPALRAVEEFSVELWRTSRGSYRMRVPPANRVIRVERVE